MELSPLQIAVIGTVCSILVQIVKMVMAKSKSVKVNKKGAQMIALATSVLLAALFMWPTLTLPTGSPVEYIEQTITLTGTVFGFATVIYTLVLKQFLDGIGFTEDKVLKTPEPIEASG